MRIQKERKLLLALSAVFAVMAFALFGYGLTTKAAEDGITVSWMNETECPRLLEYSCTSTNSSNDTRCEIGRVHSKYPIVGWYTNTSKTWVRHAAVDLENKKYYELDDEDVTGLFYWEYATTSYTEYKTGKVTYPVDEKMCIAKDIASGHTTLSFDAGALTYSGMLFEDKKSFENYVNTGSADGMVKGDDNPVLDDFDGEYDSSVPIPQLTNLSHNGFRVSNNATTLELDLQVKSYFYGLEHIDPSLVRNSTQAFGVDENQLFDEHTYVNIINSEIGFTGSEVVLTDETYFKCKNRLDLFSDGIEYFHTSYPSHKDLDSYSWSKHGSKFYTAAWSMAKAAFSANEDLDVALDLTGQAVTKYYVRFRELRPTDVAGVYEEVPGQWYCYTYKTGKATGVSPVEGDPNGNPIETDPIWGEQDDDGNPVYRDPSIPNIDTENPLEMLKGFLELVTSLPNMVGELNLFLSDTFCFIPEKYWTLILAGVAFSVLFLVFSWFRG